MLACRWLIAIFALVAIGGTHLALRQQRLRAMHESIQLHNDTLKHRQSLWRMQAELSEKATTKEIRQAMQDAGLSLSPLPPKPEDEKDKAEDGEASANTLATNRRSRR